MKQTSSGGVFFYLGLMCVFVSLVSFGKGKEMRKADVRSKIGSVFSAPVSANGKLYFVSTSGVLIESDPEIKDPKPLFLGKRQSLGALTIADGRLIWGDGLHSDQNSEVHIYDLKLRKVIQSIPVKGHVERVPLVLPDRIVIPLGFGGFAAYDKKSFKELWRVEKHDGKTIHVDSNPVSYGNDVCVTPIYEVKGVLCVDQQTGRETRFSPLMRDPKSEIVRSGDLLVGFATDANLRDAKFDIPSDLYVYDLKIGKMRWVKELRGFNFFPPVIHESEAFVTLSTGDFILIDLVTQKITFLGEYPEPFVNQAFRSGDQYCAVGVGGKYSCYLKTKGGSPGLSKDLRLMETVLGKVSEIENRIYLPTRIGYSIQ